MRFASIYIPSYVRQEATAKEFLEKYWPILLLVLALHAVIFSLLQGADASLQKDLPQEYLQYWNRAQTSKFGLVPL